MSKPQDTIVDLRKELTALARESIEREKKLALLEAEVQRWAKLEQEGRRVIPPVKPGVPVFPRELGGPRMKIYIAGKITGDDNYRAKFLHAQCELETAGHTVLSPAILPDGFGYDAYMRMSGAMLSECDAVCFLSDWVGSQGAIAEYAQAYKEGKEIFPFETWHRAIKRGKPGQFVWGV